MLGLGTKRLAACLLAVAVLTGCDESGKFNLKDSFKPKAESESDGESASRGAGVERDVEAPDVFSETAEGLWDGRPSLGGVWVAHPDVKDPERVMIRNTANGKSVVGALFRRERETPGPVFQVSSDAAASLDLLAGAPVSLSVIALRREEVPEPAPAEAAVPEPDAVTETSLDPVAAAAGAAIEAAPKTPSPTPSTPKAEPVQSDLPLKRAGTPAPSSVSKPYIQIGIFSVEKNAESAATQMRKSGMVPEVRRQSAGGKTFWRVLVGPASSNAERDSLLSKIKGQGFNDAYAVAS